MTIDEIKALIEAMGSSDLAEMEVAKGGWTLRLVRHGGAVAPAGPSATTAEDAPDTPPASPRASKPAAPKPVLPELRAPLSGIVYLSPSPDAPAFVTVGQAVEAAAVICTIEAMKTFNEVRAERAGIVEAVLVAGGDEVEAGQPLVRFG